MTILEYMNDTGMTFWRSVPVSLAVVLAEWLTLLFFARSYLGGPSLGKRSLALDGAVLLFSLLLQSMHFQLVVHYPAQLVLCAIYICLKARCPWFNGVYEGAFYCLMIELGKSLCRDGLLAYALTRAFPQCSGAAVNGALFSLYIAYLLILSLFFARRERRRLELPVSFPQAIGLLFPLFLYLAVRFLQYEQVDRLDNFQWLRYDLIQYAVAGCALIQIATLESLLLTQMEAGEWRRRQMVSEERMRQVELQRETIDFMNRRWHDMKHALTALEVTLDGEGRGEAEALIGEMKKGIDLYGDMQRTGNQVLDVMLFQYMRECRTKDIALTAVIDATKAGFLSAIDLSALFGNAMDNAIEAAQAVDDPAKRAIHVKVGASGGLLLMRFHNHFAGARREAGGRYLTTKEDGKGHGCGLANISDIAEKYLGTAKVERSGDSFTLTVMLPIGEDA